VARHPARPVVRPQRPPQHMALAIPVAAVEAPLSSQVAATGTPPVDLVPASNPSTSSGAAAVPAHKNTTTTRPTTTRLDNTPGPPRKPGAATSGALRNSTPGPGRHVRTTEKPGAGTAKPDTVTRRSSFSKSTTRTTAPPTKPKAPAGVTMPTSWTVVKGPSKRSSSGTRNKRPADTPATSRQRMLDEFPMPNNLPTALPGTPSKQNHRKAIPTASSGRFAALADHTVDTPVPPRASVP
jgi:hypothetical protein